MKDWKEKGENKNEKGVTLLVAVITVAVLLTIAIIVVLIVIAKILKLFQWNSVRELMPEIQEI